MHQPAPDEARAGRSLCLENSWFLDWPLAKLREIIVVYFSFVFSFSNGSVMRQAAGGIKQFASLAFIGNNSRRGRMAVQSEFSATIFISSFWHGGMAGIGLVA
jgi:hypothetical protein